MRSIITGRRELAEIALEIEAGVTGGVYPATDDELKMIDQAERSGIASEADVQAAFRAFAVHES